MTVFRYMDSPVSNKFCQTGAFELCQRVKCKMANWSVTVQNISCTSAKTSLQIRRYFILILSLYFESE